MLETCLWADRHQKVTVVRSIFRAASDGTEKTEPMERLLPFTERRVVEVTGNLSVVSRNITTVLLHLVGNLRDLCCCLTRNHRESPQLFHPSFPHPREVTIDVRQGHILRTVESCELPRASRDFVRLTGEVVRPTGGGATCVYQAW